MGNEAACEVRDGIVPIEATETAAATLCRRGDSSS